MRYEYNHYIQKALLKEFSHKRENTKVINIYDVQEHTHFEGDISKSFGESKLYWDYDNEEDVTQIEKDFNTYLEQYGIDLIRRVIQGDEINITRKDLFDLKRYILAQLLRTSASEEWEQRLIDTGFEDRLKVLFPQFKFKEIPNETPREKWLRGLKVVLENDFDNIVKSNDLTLSVAKFHTLVNNGYYGIWEADDEQDFIVSDIAITFEMDKDHTKEKLLESFMKKGLSKKFQIQIFSLLYQCTNFHENFLIFPITPRKAFVVMNPIIKSVQTDSTIVNTLLDGEHYFPPTGISKKHYKPNKHYYMNQDVIDNILRVNQESTNIVDHSKYYTERDIFIYEVSKLSKRETIYVNKLVLDRVQKIMGYSDFDKIKDSLDAYRRVPYQRVSYRNLSSDNKVIYSREDI